MHKRWEMDCRDFLSTLEASDTKVNGVITDPPYDYLEPHRAIGTTTRLVNKWMHATMTLEEIQGVFEQLYDVMTNRAHLYCFTNTSEALFDIKAAISEAGFTYWNLPIWDKIDIGMGYHYRNQYEPILFFSRGKKSRKLKDLSQSNIFRYKRPKGMPPYAKPITLYERILRCASEEGDLWLDPWAGTDPLSVASQRLPWNINTWSIDLKFPPEAYPYSDSVMVSV